MTTPASIDERATLFAEFEIVRLRDNVADDETVFRSGSRGTIVHCYDDGTTYEVEFDDPVAAVLTLGRLDIEHDAT